jgi:hypothetical protein
VGFISSGLWAVLAYRVPKHLGFRLKPALRIAVDTVLPISDEDRESVISNN